ncbi:MAG: transcription elongation factor GreA [Candidatus Theseobacter exili]|nr:transcription elongation factor GreA [Candidatus Theseobacter exili]
MPNYMTHKTHNRLHKRLKHLINTEKPAVTREISVAAEHGDLSENAEYDAAKAKQELLSKEIFNITQKLDGTNFIEELNIPGDRVTLGVSVILEDIEQNKKVPYTILGPDDSDVEKGIISYLSPIAKCLIGKVTGDTCVVQTPSGKLTYKLLEITKAF